MPDPSLPPTANPASSYSSPSSSRAMPPGRDAWWRAVLWRGLPLAALWLLLTDGRLQVLWLGGIAVVLALGLSLYLWPPVRRVFRLLPALAFAAFFIRDSLIGGWQVALIALRGRQALDPGFVDYDFSLPPGPARIFMVLVVSLIPGTLSVRLRPVNTAGGADQHLRIHVLDRRQPVSEELHVLEKRIAAVFGLTP